MKILPEGVQNEHKIDIVAPVDLSIVRSAVTLPSTLTFFHLGLVYMDAGLAIDLLSQFAEANPAEIGAETFHLDHALFMFGDVEWSGVVQGLPHDTFQKFDAYVRGITLTRRERRDYYTITYEALYLRQTGRIVYVYYVIGNKSTRQPFLDRDGLVKTSKLPSNAEMRKMSNELFGSIE